MYRSSNFSESLVLWSFIHRIPFCVLLKAAVWIESAIFMTKDGLDYHSHAFSLFYINDSNWLNFHYKTKYYEEYLRTAAFFYFYFFSGSFGKFINILLLFRDTLRFVRFQRVQPVTSQAKSHDHRRLFIEIQRSFTK